jgi:hypothetical protein
MILFIAKFAGYAGLLLFRDYVIDFRFTQRNQHIPGTFYRTTTVKTQGDRFK